MIHPTLPRALFASALAFPLFAQAAAPLIEVFKSASCGCCAEWVKHLAAQGFTVHAKNVPNPADYRAKAGIPNQFGSCHTAQIQGYAIEGHVPAAEIKRLIAEKTKAIGLAVAGMPMGSPGMEGPRNESYDVVLIKGNGMTTVYKHYP